MPDAPGNSDKESIPFSKKVWITVGIIALMVISLLLLKTLFSVLLLMLAAVLVAIYFYGFAGILQRNLHFSSKLSIVLSVIINILLLVAFFWFVGSLLQHQVTELSETLPKTIEQFKGQLQQSTLGNKALTYLQSTGSSEKTTAVAKKFFSSSFGILSDLYIVLLLSLFFTASPTSYKKGIVHLIPPKGKDKAEKIVLLLKGKMEQILTNAKEEMRAESKEERISIADELSKLVKLREQGVLSDSEFQKLKQKLL